VLRDLSDHLNSVTMAKLLVSTIPLVASHGLITDPPNRAGGNYEIAGTICGQNIGGTQTRDACAWLTPMVEIEGLPTLVDPLLLTTEESIANPDDTVKPGKNPWRSPGSVPVKSPCGNNFWHNELDGLDLPPNPIHTTWVAGSTVTVASALYVNHGGGWSYRLCPKSENITEECFQSHPLKYVGTEAVARFTDGRQVPLSMRRTPDGLWSRNPIPPAKVGHDTSSGLEFPMPQGMDAAEPMSWDFSVVEQLALPSDLEPGQWLLSWRWDCEKSSQVWFTCADITVDSAIVV